MEHKNWKCPRCSNTQFKTGEMRVAGSGIASMLDLEDRKFTSVTCTRCSYTEFYQKTALSLQQLFDRFTS